MPIYPQMDPRLPIDPRLAPIVHFLEVWHVARYLSVSQEYVRQRLRDGTIVAHRFGKRWRVDPVDLQAFVAAQRVAIARAERQVDVQLVEASRTLRDVNRSI